MSIFRSNNPLDFGAVDGIVIDETSPAPSIQGVGTGVAIMVGQFERGPLTLRTVSSTGDLQQTYGKNANFSGYQALRNKKFSTLRLIRVDATGAVLATKTFKASLVDIIKFDAKQGKGAYGNSITVAISAGSVSGKKYVVTDTSANAVLPQETYDNVAVASITPTSNPFATSNLIVATVIATSSEPDNASATALASGANGSASDSDYEAAIDKAAVEGAGNVLFLDSYSSALRTYLKAHAAATQDKMVIIAGAETDDKAAVITDVASMRDTDGRIIYAFPWIETTLDNVKVFQSPASWYASVFSQTAPNVDPASADNIQYLQNASDLKYHLSRQDYIDLVQAGVSSFEIDNDLGGIKIKSGVVTQVANSEKLMVFRRRMADYLTNSAGKFLKLYQNGVNSRKKRDAINAAIQNFVKQNQAIEILPTDNDVPAGSGKVTLVDTESLNTAQSLAQGYCYIVWRQRIFSSMRYIVLKAEIGTSVLVTEQ
jgi:hypothetical protein